MVTNESQFNWQNGKPQYVALCKFLCAVYGENTITARQFELLSADYGRAQQDIGTNGWITVGAKKDSMKTSGVVKAEHMRNLLAWYDNALWFYKATYGTIEQGWMEKMSRVPVPPSFDVWLKDHSETAN